MVSKAEELYQEVLALSDEERGKLMRLLVTRESHGYVSPEIEQAWLEEIKRRERDIAEGRSDWLPGDEVMRELRERYCE